MRLMSPTEVTFYAPRFLFVELFKHKDRLVRASKLAEEAVLDALNELLESVQLIDAASIPIGTWARARSLCADVDLKDTPFVAFALHLDAAIWTEDEELKKGLRAKGFDRFFVP